MLTPVFRISTLCWGTALKRNFNALPSHRHALLLPLPLVAPSLIQAPTTNERPLKLVTMGVLCTAAARAARRRIWSTPPLLDVDIQTDDNAPSPATADPELPWLHVYCTFSTRAPRRLLGHFGARLHRCIFR